MMDNIKYALSMFRFNAMRDLKFQFYWKPKFFFFKHFKYEKMMRAEGLAHYIEKN